MPQQVMIDTAMLRPVVVLVGWTLAVLAWAIVTRMAAMRAAGVDLGKLVGTKGSDADRALPAAAQWKVHNYDHLLDQPTLFYAVCLVLAVAGGGVGGAINPALAWIYVALRCAHTVVQTTSNRVRPRFYLFLLSTLVLAALTLHAAMALF